MQPGGSRAPHRYGRGSWKWRKVLHAPGDGRDDVNESNLRSASYEAVAALIQFAPVDCYGTVTQTTSWAMDRLQMNLGVTVRDGVGGRGMRAVLTVAGPRDVGVQSRRFAPERGDSFGALEHSSGTAGEPRTRRRRGGIDHQGCIDHGIGRSASRSGGDPQVAAR